MLFVLFSRSVSVSNMFSVSCFWMECMCFEILVCIYDCVVCGWLVVFLFLLVFVVWCRLLNWLCCLLDLFGCCKCVFWFGCVILLFCDVVLDIWVVNICVRLVWLFDCYVICVLLRCWLLCCWFWCVNFLLYIFGGRVFVFVLVVFLV